MKVVSLGLAPLMEKLAQEIRIERDALRRQEEENGYPDGGGVLEAKNRTILWVLDILSIGILPLEQKTLKKLNEQIKELEEKIKLIEPKK